MVPLLLWFFITGGAEFPSHEYLDTKNTLIANHDVSYEEKNNCILVLYNGKTSGVLAKKHEGTSQSSRDVLNTIWLPDSTGGVVSPNVFAYNSLNDKIYVIGLDMQNISVCDAQTGERLRTVLTGRETIDLVYSETSNKVYCSVDYDSSLLIIDGASDSVIKVIKLPHRAGFLEWNNTSNEIYCNYYRKAKIAVIDCVTDTITLTIPLVGYVATWNMLFNPATEKLYCVCHYAFTAESLVVIDCNTYSVIASLPNDSRGGCRLVLNSVNNKIYCVNTHDDNVAIIDGLGDSLITTIPLGGRPEGVAYNSIMNRLYVGHLASLNVYVIDGDNDQVITTIYLGDELWAMTFDVLDNRIFIAAVDYSAIYEEVTVLDCSTNTVIDHLPVGNWPRGIFWEETHNQVWVGNTGALNYPTYTIDGYSGDSLDHSFATMIGYTPYASTMNITSNKLYAVGHYDRYLMSLDMSDPGNPTFLDVGEAPWDVLFNPLENKIYSANRWSDTVTVIDGFADSIIAAVPTGSEPVVLALNQTDNKIYVGNLLAASLTVIDGYADSVLGTISVGNRPIPVLWNPIGNKVYCGNAFDNTLTVVDARVDTVIATVPVGDTPYTLAHNTTNNKIYCANFHSDDVTIINATTDEVIKTIYMGSGARPYAFAYNSINNKIYCANVIGNSISVIDGDADSVVKTIPICAGPFSLLYNFLTNKVFCAYVDTSAPWDERLAIIDGSSDSIMTTFSLDAGVNWIGIGAPRKALVLDSVRNIVYYSHYQASKISVIDGETGAHETVPTATPTGHTLRILPNPSRHSVRILYSLPGVADVRLAIYDISGRLVKKFENLYGHGSGVNQVIWDRTDDKGLRVPAGIYFARLETPHQAETRKLILLR